MKKHMSVFGLFARCSIFKVLLVLGVMTAVEVGAFFWVMGDNLVVENLFERMPLGLILLGGAVLVTVLLMVSASGETTAHTLNRLQISQGWVFFWHGLYNTLVYLLLWLVQVTVVTLLSLWFLQYSGEENAYSFALAMYRQPVLHSLLPMAEGVLWVRNLLLTGALGITTAHFSLRRRQGTLSYYIVAPAICVLLFVNGVGLTGGEVFSICACAGSIIAVVYTLFAEEELSP